MQFRIFIAIPCAKDFSQCRWLAWHVNDMFPSATSKLRRWNRRRRRHDCLLLLLRLCLAPPFPFSHAPPFCSAVVAVEQMNNINNCRGTHTDTHTHAFWGNSHAHWQRVGKSQDSQGTFAAFELRLMSSKSDSKSASSPATICAPER